MGVLTKSKLVMTWRTASDLSRAEAQLAQTVKWPKIGSNTYATIFDAGNIIVGYWVQQALMATLTAPPPATRTLAATALAGNRCCGQNSLSKLALVSNPASEFVVGTQSLAAFSPSLSGAAAPDAGGGPAGVSLVDDDGNFFHVLETPAAVPPAEPGAAPPAADPGAAPPGAFAAEPGEAPAAGLSTTGVANPFAGFNFMVSDLIAAKKFYTNTLGLTVVQSSATKAVYRSGRVTITLSQESAVGLVKSLNTSGRMNGDWLMFAVGNIEGAATQLEKLGVNFPTGIEDSPHGRGAYFTDPDGHVLNLWQPPARADDIDYFPVLNRLLA